MVDIETLEGELTAAGTPEDSFISEEKKRILHMCLDRIEPDLREAFWLVYFEDMSYAEAAAVMKVNVKKISNLLTRGKEKMREELAREGIDGYYL